jgi:hypothetical protein
VLWVALAEKAYAQLNAFDGQDGVAAQYRGLNSYTALDGLTTYQVLNTLTGHTAYRNDSAAGVAQALAQGNLIVLGTGNSTGSPHIETTHAYAVIGYNANTQMFTLFNPWGVSGGTDPDTGEHIWGTVYASADFLEAHFTNDVGWVGAAPGKQFDVAADFGTGQASHLAGLTDGDITRLFAPAETTAPATDEASAPHLQAHRTAALDQLFSASEEGYFLADTSTSV